ncbi:MAG TPA: hypothetical protein VFH03_24210 [Actinoplanes sp.]|nr:hypothetical protein [Actinoplanes sp.]
MRGRQRPRRPYPDHSGRGHRAAAVPPALLQSSGQRRISEILLPASVILAGVLVVVAFAFIVNRATRDDEADVGIPLPQPPALGEVPLAPTDQGLPPSPSSTSPAPSPPATRTTPPARRTTPPPANHIDVDRAGVPDTVDLSGEGRLDWVHWGEQSTFSLERDAGGDFKIREGPPTAPRQRHQLSPERFRWSGGAPVARSDGTRVGINTCGEDNGFTLSAPASRTERTLRLYVGALQSRGRLAARLSTGGGTRAGELERRGDGMATAVFVVTYRAARDGELTLSWITEETFGSGCAGVALQAATLR